MRKLTLLLCLPLLFSCGGNSSEKTESGNILENLSFTVDTVLIDAGEDFFVLNSGLGAKVISEDGNTLYFFERDPLNLVEVDLNSLRLVRKTPFQKEGPDGIGSYLLGFQVSGKEELFIHGFNTLGKYNFKGEKTENLNIMPEGIDKLLAENLYQIYGKAIFDFEKYRIFSQPSGEEFKEKELFIIDPSTKTLRRKSVPEMKAVNEFSGTLTTISRETKMVRYFGVGNYISLENGQIFLSAGSMSGLYRFDIGTDSLTFIPIQHQKFPNRMQVKVNNLPTDEAEFREDRRKVFAELNYMEPLWDETRKMYLRLGKKTFLGEKQGDPSKFEVFLFAYDEDFKVLGETKIEGLKQVPENYFWKNGKLWSYVNVEDELGFAVMEFTF
ncbi:DUF4221 family protein [Algoriphagus confluentis]|uniref:DUF4221 domain-containing protein n=1 Tax=Algoriphagus confluentis TaxID=1697556 RepID=A0ABQ6PTM0_9BACT|nr:hypothetical protein Aconfl_27250 [Algoriphagus confluentis]